MDIKHNTPKKYIFWKMNSLILFGFLFVVASEYGDAAPDCKSKNNNAFAQEYGRIVFRVSSGCGINVYEAFTVGSNPKLVSGDADDFSDMEMNFKGGWTDRTFLDSWKKLFVKDYKQVRFTMWKDKLPVVDIIFDGRNSDIQNWFVKDKVISILRGPVVNGKGPFNRWSMKGEPNVARHFYVNRNYGGCQRDYGFFMVSDSVKKEVCMRVFNGKKGWNSFPQFLYSKNKSGTLMSAPLGMADCLTIAVK